MTEVWRSTTLAAGVLTTLALAWCVIACARRLGRLRVEGVESTRRFESLMRRVRLLESVAGARPEAQTSSRRIKPRRRIDPPTNSASKGPTLITVPSLASTGSEAAASEASADLGRRFGAIWTMADAGASLDAISRSSGHPVGQIELILGLRRPTIAATVAETHEAAHDA